MGVADFAALPPEINSGRMYAGPGSGPLVTAATAWGTLATELNSAAFSYRAVLSGLTDGPWVGPSSRSMAAAVAPYVSWLSATAAHAGQTASQLGSAVASYEAAFAATVPPAAIEVNRALLASLVATNILGQNTPAIAATEAQYAEMWAQDAAAMYGYAGASAAATRLTAFVSPPQTTNPAGATTQAAAATAGPSAQSTFSSVPNLLQSLSSGSFSGSNPLLDFLNSYPIQTFNQFSTLVEGYEILSEGLNFDASGLCLTIAPPIAAFWNPVVSALSAPATAASHVSPAGSGLAAGLGSPALVDSSNPATGLGNAGVSAGLGRAASVGTLSVPQSWGTAPAIRLAATAFPAAGLDGLPQAGPAGPGGFYGGMPPMGPVASVVNAPRGDQGRLRAGARHKVIPALAGESGMNDDAAAGWVKPNTNADGDEAVSERDELNQLRKAIADVTRQRDVLKRTAATLIKEAAQK
ncbi:PPE family protein [Mycobacterium malmoense]|uniref:PPE family protein n=1 Tax=Mycobacterium malmoense TaxID=1780 RepID=UPI003F5EC4C3